MPIPVVCPACAARMNAPDQAVGKTVTCPKCQTQVPVPVPRRTRDEDDRPGSRRPVPPDEGPDDEASDYDDRPRGQRGKKSAMPVVLIVALVALMGLAVLAAFSYLLLGRAPVAMPPVAVGPVAVPGGPMMAVPAAGDPEWIDVEDEALDFRAAFPNRKPAAYQPAGPDPVGTALAEVAIQGGAVKHLRVADGGRAFVLSAAPVRLSGMPARAFVRRLVDRLSALHPGYRAERGQDRHAAGHPCQDVTFKNAEMARIVRVVVTPQFAYMLTVEGGPTLNRDEPIVEDFFAEFDVIRATTVPDKPKTK